MSKNRQRFSSRSHDSRFSREFIQEQNPGEWSHTLIDVSNFTLRRKYQSNKLENQIILEEKWYFRKDTKVFVEKVAENHNYKE